MKRLICVWIFCMLAGIVHAQKMDLTYKLNKGDTLAYVLDKVSECAIMTKAHGEEAKWKESGPQKRAEEFSIKVKDVFEKADGETIYVLEFEVKPFDEKNGFRAAMTPKGKFLFYDEEEREAFLETSDIWRPLYAGLAFPKLPNEKVEVGDEYWSPDLIMAYHRDYNLVFSGNDVFINMLEIKESDENPGCLILKGSKKSKFKYHRTQYDYDMSKTYIFDTENSIATYGRFQRKKGKKSVLPDPEEPPRRSDTIWEVKLISINGKKVE